MTFNTELREVLINEYRGGYRWEWCEYGGSAMCVCVCSGGASSVVRMEGIEESMCVLGLGFLSLCCHRTLKLPEESLNSVRFTSSPSRMPILVLSFWFFSLNRLQADVY